MSTTSSHSKSLLKQILFDHPWTRIQIILSSLFATVFGLLAPYFQKEFIDHLIGIQNPDFFHLPFQQPLAFMFLGFLAFMIAMLFSQLTNYLGIIEAIRMQGVFAQKLYLHNLSLRSDTLKNRPVGEIVSMYSTDVPGATVFLDQTLPTGASTFFPLVLTPIFIVSMYQTPAIPTFLIILTVVIFNSWMAYRQSKFFYNFKMLAAIRTGFVNEWIQNIKTIRVLGWMQKFEEKIFAVRKIETENRVTMVTNGQIMNAVSSTMTFFLNTLAILSFVSMHGNGFSPGKLMALLWVIGIFLTRPFRQMPWFFTFAFDAWTSLTRLQSFMDLRNVEPQIQKNPTTPADREHSKYIDVKSLNLTIGSAHILKNMNFEIHKGEFIAVVGEVGSGKSLLLQSLIKETGAEFEQYYLDQKNALDLTAEEIRSQFTYLGQEGFIMSSTLRDNIAFAYDANRADDKAMKNSLRLSQLDLDQEQMVNSLELAIGERGVNLSGGQKQRISIARSDFLAHPIILMDDSLSALDVETEKLLLKNLIQKDWKDKTRILVTHRLSVLKNVDRVFFLKEGQLIAQGTFTELLQSNAEFREFTSSLDEKNRTQTEAPAL